MAQQDDFWLSTLDPEECFTAVCVGGRRELKAVLNLHRDRVRWRKPREFGFTQHIEGAAAEMAVAKRLNLFWSGLPLENWTKPDVGFEFEVKLRTNWEQDKDMGLKGTDPDDKTYVLVHGKIPSFWLIGWCFGYEFPRSQPSDFIWVPPSKLHKMDEMRGRK